MKNSELFLMLIIVFAITQRTVLTARFNGHSDVHANTLVTNNLLKMSVPEQEMVALESFYDAMNGKYWTWHNDSSTISEAVWNFTGEHNPCIEKWQGVTCLKSYSPDSTVEHYNIGTLKLNSYNLTGTIPGSIANLTNLIILDLSSNSINGTLPVELGTLRNLSLLALTDNAIRGRIPVSLSSLSQLTVLSLGLNELSGSLPPELSKLSLLELLSVEYNHLEGTLPSGYQSLHSLTWLYIQFNRLTGSFEQLNFAQWPALKSLYINNNEFTGTVPESLNQLTALRSVFIDYNHFTGALPAMCSSPELEVIALNTNAFTGTLPACYGRVPGLVSMTLVGNFLTGSIPSTYTQITKMAYMVLNHNLLEGRLPAGMANLTNVVFMFLQDNMLSGPLDTLVNATTQRAYTYLDISTNQFTGTLPADLYKLQSLQSFSAASNCITGSISDAFCAMPDLTFINLDGMNTASSCQFQFFPHSRELFRSYSLRQPITGGVPECLFNMDNLTTLHLSGNGIDWSFPSHFDITSSALADLALSHNRIKGSIPESLFQRQWSKLDLSYNKLTGVIGNDINLAAENTSLYLQVNRLSGKVPHALHSFQDIRILDGNLFSCDIYRSDLPVHDSQYSTYQCGSNSFNQSLTVWGVVMVILSVAVVAVLVIVSQYSVSRHSNAIIAWFVRLSRTWNQALEVFVAHSAHLKLRTEAAVSQLEAFREYLLKLRRTFVCLTVVVLIVCVPVYIALTHYYTTLTHGYAWIVSAAFLSGVAPAVIMMFVFVAVLAVLLYLLNYSSTRLVIDTAINPVTLLVHNHHSGLASSVNYRRYFGLFCMTLVNCVVTVVVNGVYVYTVLTCTTAVITATQILVALFKLVWNEFAVRAMMLQARRFYALGQGGLSTNDSNTIIENDLEEPLIGSAESATKNVAAVESYDVNNEANHQLIEEPNVPSSSADQSHGTLSVRTVDSEERTASRDMVFLAFIILFNNILAPCLATAAVSPSCFRNVFIAAPPVESTFPFTACPSDGFTKSDSCTTYGDGYLHTSYDPPFIYSYQCSSTLVTNYAEVFVYMFLLLAFAKPLAYSVLCSLHAGDQNSCLYRLADTVLPKLLKHTSNSSSGVTGGPLFDKEKFAMQIVGMVGVFLTFGVVLPPLAVVTLVALYAHTYYTQFTIGRFLCAISPATALRAQLADQIGTECTGSDVLLRYSMRVIVPFTLVFYSLFIFDTAGDQIGWKRAIWAPVSMLCLPVIAYIVHRCRRYCMKRNGNSASAVSGGGGIGGDEESRGVSDVRNVLSLHDLKQSLSGADSAGVGGERREGEDEEDEDDRYEGRSTFEMRLSSL